MNALGMIEVQSIPLGVNAGDAMLKAATVQLVTAQPVCAGKYIVIVTGEVSAVSESVAAGKAEAGQRLIDSHAQSGKRRRSAGRIQRHLLLLQLRTMHLLRLQLRPEALAGDADAQICHCLEGRSPP